ncbi:anti-sigma factor family protein [Polyangium mundeleinium]|uniref:Anti sigma-E protein RseA N-terminal domain-containing protein n=1 Tax=Polyangium mundeleinium TaxID=2995306 RepID=A0ABT5F355_9BACT|nr:hypothetical protein [Polyangium mundeleinium]MDC0748536.1 hypothetical protein [Polyangium mundeleinium]
MTTKTMNGEAHATRTKRPPTDLELMMYVDGELEGERLREVRQALSRDSALRNKVAALSLSASIVRENAESAATIDLTDGIMARIAADKSPTRDARDDAPAPLDAPLERKDAEVKPLLRPGLDKAAAKSPPLNDNSRGIFALAAIAVAAAAGLMIWGRMDVGTPHPQGAPVAAATTPAELPATPAPTTAEAARVADTDAQDGDAEPGVAVAAVDFGTKIGTIFYVPAEAATSNHTTTVVWLADDSAGGEQ